ncbi:hypothetical protein MTO96_005786 [Rhipicephalus appendiculatus]
MGAPQMLDWIYLSGNLQGLRSDKINIGDTEILLSKKLASLLSCFALTGNPEKCTRSPLAHWVKATDGKLHTLVVENATTLVMQKGLPFGDACQEWDAIIANSSVGAARTRDSAIRVLNATRTELQQIQHEDKVGMSNASRGGETLPLAITRLTAGGRRAPKWANYLARFLRDNHLEHLNWSSVD